MTSEEPGRTVKQPTVLAAVVPLVTLILLIFGSLLIFGLDALDSPIQVALVLACICAELVALWLGYRWTQIEEVGRVAMGTITSAIFILLAVGALIGTWNLSGTIPTVELAKLDQIYWINPVNLLPLALLIFLSVRKVPASLSLITAALLAALMAPLTQPSVVAQFVGAGAGLSPVEALKAGWQAIATGFEINSGIPDIDRLLSRGGMDSMLLTLWLIIGAVTFGTLIEELWLIARLTSPLINWASSTGKLYLAVFASAFGLNVFAGDQYIALVLPARIYRVEFAKRGLAPTNLSRLTADSGTVTSPLVPWNSCGAFMGAVLGVPTVLYLPFGIFCIASPLLSVIYGLTGFKIKRVEPVTEEVA
jgi:Na+:H+ antiporter, NhaC family